MTKAQLSLAIGRLLRKLSGEAADYAEGMWNPYFCAADANVQALALVRELREMLNHIESRCKAVPAEPAPAE